MRSVGEVSINDIRTGEQARIVLEDRDSMWDWSPDGRWFAVSSRTSTVVWDSTTRKVRKLLTRAAAREAMIYHHAWSPDGKQIACPFGDGSVRVLETATGAEARKLAPAGGAHTARWSPDGKRIAVAGPSGVAAFAADTGKELFAHKVKAAPPITRVLEWSPKGKWLAASVAAPATGETLLVFDGTTGERKWALTAGHLQGRVVPNWSPLQWPPDEDQHLAWTSDPEGRLFALWDLNTGRSVHRGSRPGDSPFKPKDGAGWIEMLYWAPSGRVVDWSSPIQPPGFTTWSISPPRRLASAVLGREQNPIYTNPLFAFSPNGKRVAVIFPHVHTEPRDGRSFVELLVWDAETGKEVFRSRAFPAGDRIEGLGSITWSPDSKRIVVAGGLPPRRARPDRN